MLDGADEDDILSGGPDNDDLDGGDGIDNCDDGVPGTDENVNGDCENSINNET